MEMQVWDMVMEEFSKAENYLIFTVLSDFLGHMAELEDAKRCSLHYYDDRPGEYLLVYNNYLLGKIVHDYFNPVGKIAISFIPINERDVKYKSAQTL